MIKYKYIILSKETNSYEECSKKFVLLFLMFALLISPCGSFIAATTDTEGPKVILESLKVSKQEVNLGETVEISYQLMDDSEIASYSCGITLGNGYGPGYGMRMDTETGICTFDYIPNYYGLAEIVDLVVVDVNGNTTRYINTAHSKYGELGYNWEDDTAIYADLSAANFYVGIKDEGTGIFVSGSDITEDTKLDVEEKEFEGSDYDKMKEHSHKHDNGKHHGHHPHGYYDIHVKDHNNGGNKFKVFFDVPWAKDGEMVRVSHMKHDGTIQIEDLPAKNGRVWMEVTEFSPFLVEQIVINNTQDTTSGGNQNTPTGGNQNTDLDSNQATNETQSNSTEDTSDSKKDENSNMTSPKTGDDEMFFVYFVSYMMIISLGLKVCFNKKLSRCIK